LAGGLKWYRAERIFIHLHEPSAALAEERRVLAPGGIIVLADQDFDSTVITSDDQDLTRTMVAALTAGRRRGRREATYSWHEPMPGLLIFRTEQR